MGRGSLNRELEELLEQIEDIRRTAPHMSDAMDSVAKIIKDELDRTKARQTGPAIGQRYWCARAGTPGFAAYTGAYTYTANPTVLDICKFRDIYPEKRFAEAELRARELIQAVKNRRRELNEGKEFEDHKCYIVFWNAFELDFCEGSIQGSAPGFAYPFGLFKDSLDCETCIDEFEDDLDWFFRDYFPIMEELDDYDWADAPGWREED